MQEIELKFQIPAGRAEDLRAAIEALSPGQAPLLMHAAYHDTADNALARQKMALRVRREGEQWVQTFKAAGRDAMTRVEDNQIRQVPDGRLPRPDLSLHTGAARQALSQALPWRPMQDPRGEALGLLVRYETRFDRRQAVVPRAGGQVIVCIDEGEVTAGLLSEPLSELELELADGHAHALLAMAREWVAAHGVWLDVQSKAYRGTRLAQASLTGQAPATRPVSPTHSDDPMTALSLALDAAAGNWSEVAALRPGWPDALLAWHQALSALLLQAQGQAGVNAALPATVWQATRVQADALAGLLAGASSSVGARGLDAQALAMHPSTTGWALDVLMALKH